MSPVFLAKTIQAGETVQPGCSVYEHCRIVGDIARILMDMYPAWIKKRFFPAGTELVAASHDIGKISPSFQEKIRRALGHAPNSAEGLENPKIAAPQNEKEWGGHAGASALALRALRCKEPIQHIAARHHGHIVNTSRFLAGDAVLGGPLWQGYRTACLDMLKAYFACDWPTIDSSEQEILLSGLTSVADWIGSGEILSTKGGDPEQCASAVRDAGFVSPSFRSGLSFYDIFGQQPRDMQKLLADTCDGPGIYVLEAPMGLGKTEAALYAAYGLLASGKATGIYFGLPTRLTSNKIHERIVPFLHKILEQGSARHHAARLLHGMAHLEQSTFSEDDASGESDALWFSSLKRGILAPFGVGTIDQALMAAIPDIRHSFVRALGLLGKVVILDEVHSYDAYTFAIIKKLLALLNNFGCTVIILSATLTATTRVALLGDEFSDPAYPLLSCKKLAGGVVQPAKLPPELPADSAKRESPAIQLTFAASRSMQIAVTVTPKRGELLEIAIDKALTGQQVLWIENTVAEAQDVYACFAARCAELPVACGLIHSRFTQEHRNKHEEHWTTLYGKNSAHRAAQGRILVGTQVLEQSLDIDADCLFSALCPMDMLLQRMGRLWRHADSPRPEGAKPAVFVILQQAMDVPLTEDFFGASGAVYEPYVLYRTQEQLERIGPDICLPEAIRPLLEATYVQRKEDDKIAAKFKIKLRIREDKLETFAERCTAGWESALPDSEEVLGTRYSERRTRSVLLLKQYSYLEDGIQLTLLNGTELCLDSKQLSARQRRELAAVIMRQIVQVRAETAPAMEIPARVANCLRPLVYLGRDNLSLGIVENSGVIRNLDGSPANEAYAVQYTERLGYRDAAD